MQAFIAGTGLGASREPDRHAPESREAAAQMQERLARTPEELALLAWAAAHGLVVLVRDGALQAMTGTPTAEGAAELAHSLVDTFTHGIRSSEPT